MLIGEIKQAKEIGYTGGRGSIWFMWCACKNCGKERWVRIKDGEPRHQICRQCSGKARWKGGCVSHRDGYVRVFISPNDFYHSMSSYGYVLEHRLVMAKHLGRCLQRWEVVHHKNGIRTDNQLTNLELSTNTDHRAKHSKGYRDGYKNGYYDGKVKRIRELEEQVRMLQKVK